MLEDSSPACTHMKYNLLWILVHCFSFLKVDMTHSALINPLDNSMLNWTWVVKNEIKYIVLKTLYPYKIIT